MRCELGNILCPRILARVLFWRLGLFALWLKNGKSLRRWWWPLLAVPSFALVGVFTLPSGERVVEMIGAAAFAWLLCFLHPIDVRIADWRPIRWLGWVGTISYSLYLTHVTFMGKVINLASHRVAPDSVLQYPVQVAGWAAAIVGAWIVFRLCEQPLERWRHSDAQTLVGPDDKSDRNRAENPAG